jgi:hypothetical protein
MKFLHLSRATVVGAGLIYASTAQGELAGYTYDVGPNYVEMSGASCRATSEEGETNLNRLNGSVIALTSGTNVVCPINRRSTTMYARTGNTANPDTTLTVNSLTVVARDPGSGSISCFAYADRLTTNSVIFGTTRYLCSTAGGCGSAPASYSGINSLTLPFPTFNGNQTVNFGFKCTLNATGEILYSSTSISPNL